MIESEPHYTRVKRSDHDIALAIYAAVLDDLWHTDNMADRINASLGYGEGYTHVDYHDMIAVVTRLYESERVHEPG